MSTFGPKYLIYRYLDPLWSGLGISLVLGHIYIRIYIYLPISVLPLQELFKGNLGLSQDSKGSTEEEGIVLPWRLLSRQTRSWSLQRSRTPGLARFCRSELSHVYAYVYTHIYTHTYTYIYMYVCTHTCTHICTHKHVYIYIHMYVYTYKYVYIQMCT